MADVGAPTAASDLRRLEAAGFLRATGAGRSTAYVGTPRPVGAVASAAGIAPPDAQAPLDAQRAAVVAGIAGTLRGGGTAGAAGEEGWRQDVTRTHPPAASHSR